MPRAGEERPQLPLGELRLDLTGLQRGRLGQLLVVERLLELQRLGPLGGVQGVLGGVGGVVDHVAAGLPDERGQRLPGAAAGRLQIGAVLGPTLVLKRLDEGLELLPGGRGLHAGLGGQVLAVVQDPGVGVPGHPVGVPFTATVFHGPSKKSPGVTRSAGTGSRPPPLANSPIQVVPSRLTSGVWRPAMAVEILSWAPSQGTAVTLTVASGLSFWNSAASLGSSSPSVPMAQTVISPVAGPSAIALDCSAAPSPPPSSRPQPARARTAASSSAPMVLRAVIAPPCDGARS